MYDICITVSNVCAELCGQKGVLRGVMAPSDEKQLTGISYEMKVNPQHHKFLIGPADVNIQKIRDETGARIIFPGFNSIHSW